MGFVKASSRRVVEAVQTFGVCESRTISEGDIVLREGLASGQRPLNAEWNLAFCLPQPHLALMCP